MSDSVELLEALESLGLVAVSQTEVLRREWTDNDSISKDEATSRLLQRNLITPFQAERLSIGDASSLVLGDIGNLEERLATAGIGGDMPGYAGAIAPQRVAQWNWDVTWRSRTHQTPIDAPEDASQQ